MILRVDGLAPADLAWERYAVFARWPECSPQITRVDSAGPRIRPGMTGVVHGWFGVRVRYVIDSVDEEARRWSWTVELGPLRLRLDHGVDARPDGCSTWLNLHAPLPLALAYAPLARLALRRLVSP